MKTKRILQITLCGAIVCLHPSSLVGQSAENESRAVVTAERPPDGNSPQLSANIIKEIVKLHDAGVAESVILAYIENTRITRRPDAEEIIELHDRGVSPRVITALLARGKEPRVRPDTSRQQTESDVPPETAPYQRPAPAPAQPTTVYVTPTVTYPATTPTYTPTYLRSSVLIVGSGYRHYYYPRSYYYPSYYSYPRYRHYSPRFSFRAGFGHHGFHKRFHGGFRHCW